MSELWQSTANGHVINRLSANGSTRQSFGASETATPPLCPPNAPAIHPVQSRAGHISNPASAASGNTKSALFAQHIGRVVTVQGSNARVELLPGPKPQRAEIGAMVKILANTSEVISIISALSVNTSINDDTIIVDLVLVGELCGESHVRYFRRGVAHFPCIGDDVFIASATDIASVYGQTEQATLNVGSHYQDPSIPAQLMTDELFSKHFAIVGTTGSGKSSALTCILRQALEAHQYAHMLILDMHGEYHRAFGKQAEVIGAADLYLPFWLLNFQELRSVLTSRDEYYEAQVEVLTDAIFFAKRRFLEITMGRIRTRALDTASGTVDSPIPFRLSDVITYIDEQLGRLERPYAAQAYRRLKTRIEMLTTDPRYAFMFGTANVEDTMVDVLSHLFRVTEDGKPISVIELGAIPDEILDVVVLLIARLTFDIAIWSDGELPVLLVCEEAHRYIPADEKKGFFPTREALSRIAKEGRKYGISLALLTQRPSELDSTVLSQCSTVLAMRLSTELDQQMIRSNVHDSSFGILEYLPLLGDREAIVMGCGAPMPMRIKFRDLPASCLPHKSNHKFTQRWASPNMDRSKLEATVARWRNRTVRR